MVNNLSIFVFIGASIVLFISIAAGEIQNNGGNNGGDGSCSWGSWNLGACNVPCGAGKQIRTRTCMCYPRDMKPTCKGANTETYDCNAGPCCTWMDWTEWSDCDEGFQMRQKNCSCQATAVAGTRVTGARLPSESGDNCVEPSNCDGEQPKERRPCPETPEVPETTVECNWGDWSEFSSCSRNCDGGLQTRTRQCMCNGAALNDTTKGDSMDSSYSKSTDMSSSTTPCACNGSALESIPCNSFPCCTWGNLTEWSPCNKTCGGFRRRIAQCNCMPRYPTMPSDCDNNTDSDSTQSNTHSESKDGSHRLPTDCGENNLNDCESTTTTSSDSMDGSHDGLNKPSTSENSKPNPFVSDSEYENSLCLGPQPYEEEECNSTCGQQQCEWNMWSEWTQCDKFCNGTQFRRQLCICGDDLNCDETYSDSLCSGVPETEIRSCNVLESCSCAWNFTENWSECMADNHCCGTGKQWRRQACLCDGEESDDASTCLLSGLIPLTESRECNMSCCQFGPATPIPCDQLMKSAQQASDLCITTWKQRDCLCPDGNGGFESGNLTQCAFDSSTLLDLPISFDRSVDYCFTDGQEPGTVSCNEFESNGTCIAWNLELSDGVVNSVSDITDGDCTYSDANCWDGWSEWSSCCGTSDEAYQWRIQTSSNGLSACRQPPLFEFQNCTIENYCFWTYDDTVEWNNCSALIGDGFQSRFPYNCSCDDLALCPIPPDYEIQSCFTETESNCTWTDFETISCGNLTEQLWSSQQCSCRSETEEFMSSSCDIANCFGTPNITTLNCTQIPSGPICEWREVVSECAGECTYRLIEEYEEEYEAVELSDLSDSHSMKRTGKGMENSGIQRPAKTPGKSSDCGKSENGVPIDCDSHENQQPGYEQPSKNQPGNEQPSKNQPGKPSDCGKTQNGKPIDCDNQHENQQPGSEQPSKNQPGNEQPSKNQPGKHSDCGKSENGMPIDCNNQQTGNDQQPTHQQPGNEQPSKHSDCGKSENGLPKDCEKHQSGSGNGKPSRPIRKMIFTPGRKNITRTCYCDGVPVDSSLCSPMSLPIIETRDCTLDCNCTWTNLTDWTDCNRTSSMDNSTVDDNNTERNITQCMKRQCSCRQIMDDCDMNMNNTNSSLSDIYNFTSPTWSEACGGFDILERNYTEVNNDTQETPNPNGIMALTAESWKNCSCTWPLDTAARYFTCCVLNWYEILNKQNPNDWESLAVEYISAELNLLNGVESFDALLTALNTTLDLLNICPQNWTAVETSSALELKARLLEFNQGGSWSTPITSRLSSSNEDSRDIITTNDTPKTSFLIVLIPTVLSVAILVLVGALIFLKAPRQDSQSTIDTTNNI